MARLRTFHIGWQALCLSFVFVVSNAEAARQGSPGATSTGSISISLSVSPRAEINGADDVRFGGLEDEYRAAQDVCLWSNSLARSYTIAASGSGHGGAFELFNGNDSIGYTVELSSREQSLPSDRDSNESTLAELSAAVRDADCALGSGSANLVIALDPTHVQAARSGAPYTGTLTLLVSPT